jgi:hypothetical protein
MVIAERNIDVIKAIYPKHLLYNVCRQRDVCFAVWNIHQDIFIINFNDGKS